MGKVESRPGGAVRGKRKSGNIPLPYKRPRRKGFVRKTLRLHGKGEKGQALTTGVVSGLRRVSGDALRRKESELGSQPTRGEKESNPN